MAAWKPPILSASLPVETTERGGEIVLDRGYGFLLRSHDWSRMVRFTGVTAASADGSLRIAFEWATEPAE